MNELEVEYIEKGITKDEVLEKKLPLAGILTSPTMIIFQYIACNITFFICFTRLLPYLVSQWGNGAEIYSPIPLI